MRAQRLLVALCGLTWILLMLPASAGAELGPQGIPERCAFEEGDLGHYIVVFHDWVEDPKAVAQKQVQEYGGTLGAVYEHALKGYSAEFPPPSAQALQAEPPVKYIEISQLIWLDNSSGIIQWHSCPLAPPLGPAPPPSPPEEPLGTQPPVEESEPPLEESSPPSVIAVESTDQIVQLGAPDQQIEPVKRRTNRCKGRTGKSKRCGSRSGRVACKKLKARGRAPTVSKCSKAVP